jgi:hypothetical protein
MRDKGGGTRHELASRRLGTRHKAQGTRHKAQGTRHKGLMTKIWINDRMRISIQAQINAKYVQQTFANENRQQFETIACLPSKLVIHNS